MSDERDAPDTQPFCAPFGARVWAAALCVAAIAGALVCFFWSPIALWRTHSYTTADLSQEYSLTNVTPGHLSGNHLLSDPPVEMQPWILFARQELAQGNLPLWNPYNGGGQPLVANYQSGIFSVFNAPFYLLPFKAALLLSAALKIAALAGFTYLFLRELELDRGAALIGAFAFAFCGHNVLLLAYPHAGAAATLPAGLYFAERVLRRARQRRPIHWPLAGLSLAVGLGVLAGHPEPLGFSLIAIMLYAIARLVWARREMRAWRVGAALGAAIACGLGLGAIQVVPFAEYLAHSTVQNIRFRGQVGFDAAQWPLWFFPDLLGNPSGTYQLAPHVPAPNYEAANAIYVGPLVLFTAILALCFVRRDRRIALFGALGLLWWLAVHDCGGLLHLIERIPGGGWAPLNRSQVLGTFCASALAALGAHHLARTATRRRAALAIALIACAAIVIVVVRREADDLLSATLKSLGSTAHIRPAYLDLHISFMTWTFAGGAIALVALLVAPARWWKDVALAALATLAFLQSGWVLRDYNRCSADEHVFPRTEAVETLRQAVGDGTLLRLGEDSLPPETNIVYGIRMVGAYDAMWIQAHDELVQIDLATKKNWRPAMWASERTLRLFGVTHVLTAGDWIPADTLFPESNWAPAAPLERLELDRTHTVVQTFQCVRGGLEAICIYLSARPGGGPRSLQLDLEDESDGRVVCSRTLDSETFLGELSGTWRPIFPSDVVAPGPGEMTVFRFDAERRSKGRTYRIKLTSTGEPDANGWCAWTMLRSTRIAQTELWVDDAQRSDRLLFDASTSIDSFEELARPAGQRLWRYRTATGRAWLVHGVRVVKCDSDALGVALSAGFNAATQVILRGAVEGSTWGRATETESVRIVGDRATRLELEVDSESEGHLVTSMPWYPGWTARVDGRAVELLRANYAFQAIAVSAGKHTVELVYSPASFWIGASISALAAAALAIWCVRARFTLTS